MENCYGTVDKINNNDNKELKGTELSLMLIHVRRINLFNEYITEFIRHIKEY